MRKTFLAGKCQLDGEFDDETEPSREEMEEIMKEMMKETMPDESQDIMSGTKKPVMSNEEPGKKK